MAHQFTNPEEAAQIGREIYRTRYKDTYEKLHRGKFLAINVVDGSAVLGDDVSDAVMMAHSKAPDAFFFVVRVGHATAFKLGMAYCNVGATGLSRR